MYHIFFNARKNGIIDLSKGANTMKQLKDFESEEQFLHYLASEIEGYIMENNITEGVDTFVEFFIAHSYNAPYINAKDLLYTLAIKFLGYKKEDFPSMS